MLDILSPLSICNPTPSWWKWWGEAPLGSPPTLIWTLAICPTSYSDLIPWWHASIWTPTEQHGLHLLHSSAYEFSCLTEYYYVCHPRWYSCVEQYNIMQTFYKIQVSTTWQLCTCTECHVTLQWEWIMQFHYTSWNITKWDHWKLQIYVDKGQ